MDINEALREMRALAAAVLADKGADPFDAEPLAWQFQAIDEWICKGGFLPRDWAPGGAQ